jgi:hypothetical protein
MTSHAKWHFSSHVTSYLPNASQKLTKPAQPVKGFYLVDFIPTQCSISCKITDGCLHASSMEICWKPGRTYDLPILDEHLLTIREICQFLYRFPEMPVMAINKPRPHVTIFLWQVTRENLPKFFYDELHERICPNFKYSRASFYVAKLLYHPNAQMYFS